MKSFVLSAVLSAALPVAQGAVIVPAGAEATVIVQYEYVSSAQWQGPSKDSHLAWKVRRASAVTATLKARKPSGFATLHANSTQQVNIKNAQVAAADMQKEAEKCGEDPGCMAEIAMKYFANQNIQAAANPGPDRYQLWGLSTLEGTYEVDEVHHRQVFDMVCSTARPCRSTETLRGAGRFPKVPDLPEGAAMIEVDSQRSDLMMKLPVPLAFYTVEQRVESNIPGEKSSSGPTTRSINPKLSNDKPITVKIPGELRSLSGTETIPVKGDGAEAGTLTVKWQIIRQ